MLNPNKLDGRRYPLMRFIRCGFQQKHPSGGSMDRPELDFDTFIASTTRPEPTSA